MEESLEAWGRAILKRHHDAYMIKQADLYNLTDLPGIAIRQFVHEIERRWRTDENTDYGWSGSMSPRHSPAQRARVVPGVPLDLRAAAAAGVATQETSPPAGVASMSTEQKDAHEQAAAAQPATGNSPGSTTPKSAASPGPTAEKPKPAMPFGTPHLEDAEITQMYDQPAYVEGFASARNALIAGGMGEIGQSEDLLPEPEASPIQPLVPKPLSPPVQASPVKATHASVAGIPTEREVETLPVVQATVHPTTPPPLSPVRKRDTEPTAGTTPKAGAAATEDEKKKEKPKLPGDPPDLTADEITQMYQQPASIKGLANGMASLLAGGMGQIEQPEPPLVAQPYPPPVKVDRQPPPSAAQRPQPPPAAKTTVVSARHDTVGGIPTQREVGPVEVVQADASTGTPTALARVDRSEGDPVHPIGASTQRGTSRESDRDTARAVSPSNTSATQLSALGNLDLDELAEQVMHRFARTMELEAERRGVSTWE